MTDNKQFTHYSPPQHIPAEHGPIFWFILGGITAFSLVLLYIDWRF